MWGWSLPRGAEGMPRSSQEGGLRGPVPARTVGAHEPFRACDHLLWVKRPDRAPLEYRHMRTRLVERARDGDDVAFAELVDLDGYLCYAIA